MTGGQEGSAAATGGFRLGALLRVQRSCKRTAVRLARTITDSLNRRIGRADITPQIDPCLVQAIGDFYGESFNKTRFYQVQRATPLERWVNLLCGSSLAVAWMDDVYIMVGGVDYSGYEATCAPDHADTIAHELYHVAQFRHTGVVPWMCQWLEDIRKYGRSRMSDRLVEKQADNAAFMFCRSPEYRRLTLFRLMQPSEKVPPRSGENPCFTPAKEASPLSDNRYTIGLDFGTNSVRALIANVANGDEVATAVSNYKRGDAGVVGDASNPHVARQHPADYQECLVECVQEVLRAASQTAGFSADRIIGIGVDTTGSTPIPVNREGTALALLPEFAGNADALAWLWKDHSSMDEAEKITRLTAEHRPQYLCKSGGTYSSEWFWSKIWHCLNVAPQVFEAAYSWVEFCDYIPALLVGDTNPATLKRGVCAAGHKAMYCEEWDGLPDAEFLSLLDPKIAALRQRLYEKAYPSDVCAGMLSEEWAQKTGLPAGIPVAVGAFDAHYGAVACGVGVGTLVKILGTSTCDITVAAKTGDSLDVPGVCGIVDGSVLPGAYGIEAGQSAAGDIFNWFVGDICLADDSYHAVLTAEAEALKPGQSGLLALDWNNGNRCVLVDARLTGLLVGQTLHTSRAEIYRTLIEGTAFGALTIQNRMKEYGVPIHRIICAGGIAEKNAFLMQLYADVMGQTLEVSRSGQTCALGAAIFGAVVAGPAAGGYASAEDAQAKMTGVKDVVYRPNPEAHAVYQELYRLYMRVHDAFGIRGSAGDLTEIMKRLLDLKQRVSQE